MCKYFNQRFTLKNLYANYALLSHTLILGNHILVNCNRITNCSTLYIPRNNICFKLLNFYNVSMTFYNILSTNSFNLKSSWKFKLVMNAYLCPSWANVYLILSHTDRTHCFTFKVSNRWMVDDFGVYVPISLLQLYLGYFVRAKLTLSVQQINFISWAMVTLWIL